MLLITEAYCSYYDTKELHLLLYKQDTYSLEINKWKI